MAIEYEWTIRRLERDLANPCKKQALIHSHLDKFTELRKRLDQIETRIQKMEQILLPHPITLVARQRCNGKAN